MFESVSVSERQPKAVIFDEALTLTLAFKTTDLPTSAVGLDPGEHNVVSLGER